MSPVYRVAHFLKESPRRFALLLLAFYQRFLSPLKNLLLGSYGSCRFYPTCSQYAVLCLRKHGFVKGTLLSVFRLCKCQPFHPGGVDLPPEEWGVWKIKRRDDRPGQGTRSGEERARAEK